MKQKLIGTLLALCFPATALAFDLGPLTITGFVKLEAGRTGNICENCQTAANEQRHRPWADEITPGLPYGTKDGTLTLAQPYIATKDFDLGKGFKMRGLWSQRWRDGRVDIEGVEYERNVTFTQEDYGTLQIGKFPTRGWSIADYPYGTQIGLADAWGASGSGYGLLTRAVRYGLPKQYAFGGDVHVEATYDLGGKGYYHKPRFLEIFAQYAGGPWVIEGVIQQARNGLPSAWTHGPFLGMTVDPADDLANGPENKQSIAMVMVRHIMDAKTVLFAGLRHNRWSGAKGNYVRWSPTGDIWNTMFNIGCTNASGTPCDPSAVAAYPAQSTDLSVGFTRKLMDRVTLNGGMVHLGKANTDNPIERGQSNTMTLGTLGVGYEIQPGWSVYGFTGTVRYGHKGLAPLSMPTHASFTGVDSRLASSGRWVGIGTVYTF